MPDSTDQCLTKEFLHHLSNPYHLLVSPLPTDKLDEHTFASPRRQKNEMLHCDSK